jgi:hypothetical protein
MHAPIHLAVSWLIGSRLRERRDRRLVAWAGTIPDVDAISLFWGVEAYVRYHHVIAHGAVAALVIAVLCATFAQQKWKAVLLSLVAFHVHLLCDLIGSGAQGQPWPIVYFWPFSMRELFVPYGWDLASPENAFVWLGAVALTISAALRYGRTFGEAFMPAKADAAVVAAIRNMFERVRRAPAPGA